MQFKPDLYYLVQVSNNLHYYHTRLYNIILILMLVLLLILLLFLLLLE